MIKIIKQEVKDVWNYKYTEDEKFHTTILLYGASDTRNHVVYEFRSP